MRRQAAALSPHAPPHPRPSLPRRNSSRPVWRCAKGEIPCPRAEEPRLKSLGLSRNFFTGDLKPCLFTKAKRLQYMNIGYLALDNAAIPPEISEVGSEFVNFFAEHSGLAGPLPVQIGCLTKVIYFHLGRNEITTLPQEGLDGMSALYSLDVSYNKLSGPVPSFDANTELRCGVAAVLA